MKTVLIFMGIFSFLLSGGHAQTKDLVIDLHTMFCGHTKLGHTPDNRDFFSPPLKTSDVYKSAHEGFEAGTKQGVLDYVFITLDAYQGAFACSGKKIAMDFGTSPESVTKEFGEPYWIDSKDGELIFFYELEGGKIELQFEFPGKKKLSFITLAQDGVLSSAEQRRLYGVTKPWPPSPRKDG